MSKIEMTDDKLDALLRREFEGPLPDDGFSARVARALPPRSRPRTWPLPVAFAGGGLLAWAALTPSSLWGEVARETIAGAPGGASAVFLTCALGLGMLCCAWGLEEAA